MAKSDEQFERDYQALQNAKKEFDMQQFLLKEVDLSKYFGREELDNMCDAAQRRHKNIALNYEYMLHMGLPAIKPSFMVSPAQKARQAARERSPSPSSESDEDWTPDMGSKRKAKELKKAPHFYPIRQKGKTGKNNAVKAKKPRVSPPAPPNTVQQEEPGMSPSAPNTVQQPEPGSSQPVRRYNLRERTATNFMYLEPPDDDEFIYMDIFVDMRRIWYEHIPKQTGSYSGGVVSVKNQIYNCDCEECNKEYDMDCPVHGALDHIHDKQFLQESSVSRAEQSLPPRLVVKPSSIPGAGLGVFTDVEIPSRTMYGPYGGVKVTDAQTAHSSGYSWQVYKDGKPSHFVDALDVHNSNWMRFVNCANSESEQNLVAFQYKGGIYYRTYKHIPADTELLVWYGDEYARDLGVIRDKNLLIRPKLVNGDECYPCVFCKTNFSDAVYCVKHLVQVHGGDKLTQTDCQVLDEWLRTNTSYRTGRSAKRTECSISDTGSKSHKCDKCEYATDFKHHLVTHMRRHTGEKPFKCGQCAYAASQSCVLTKHMKTHTGDKPYKCDQCGYAASQRSNLINHMRTHMGDKPYKCDQCRYAASHSSNLVAHMRTHTGDKPFKCDMCAFAASRSSHLVTHMRIHTGEKPYKCDVCGFAATQSGVLVRHKRTHTGDKPNK